MVQFINIILWIEWRHYIAQAAGIDFGNKVHKNASETAWFFIQPLLSSYISVTTEVADRRPCCVKTDCLEDDPPLSNLKQKSLVTAGVWLSCYLYLSILISMPLQQQIIT